MQLLDPRHPETHEALVVDPGDEVDRILDVLRKHAHGSRIVSTHAHIDHVGGLSKMQRLTGAPVLMHGDDMELYRHLDVQAAWLGTRPPDAAEVDTLLREGDTSAGASSPRTFCTRPVTRLGASPCIASLRSMSSPAKQKSSKPRPESGHLLPATRCLRAA